VEDSALALSSLEYSGWADFTDCLFDDFSADFTDCLFDDFSADLTDYLFEDFWSEQVSSECS
jgi:hypothetical protein